MDKVVIIGSSIAGMATAKILASHAKEVVIIERNKLADEPEFRSGVPQVKHVHGLLNYGFKKINEIFPATKSLIIENGGRVIDFGKDVWWYQKKRWWKRIDTDLQSYALSRSLLDWVILSQLRQVTNVKIIDNSVVHEYLFNKDTNQIIGITFENKTTNQKTQLNCDLLVDASGRGTKTPRHLANLGFEPVPIKEVPIGIKYVSRHYERPQNTKFNAMLISFDAPRSSRIGVLSIAEDRFILSLGGVKGDHPPIDEKEFLNFMKNLDNDSIYQVVKTLKPISDLIPYNFDASRWFEYHRLKNFPNRLIIIGDAYSSFNPVYGQGISIALSEVATLDEILKNDNSNLEKIQKKYYKKIPKIIELAWNVSTSEDLRFEWVNADRPKGLKIMHWMSDKIAGASHDEKVLRTFFDVVNLKRDVSSLMNPIFIARVLWKNIFKGKPIRGPDIDIILKQCRGFDSTP